MRLPFPPPTLVTLVAAMILGVPLGLLVWWALNRSAKLPRRARRAAGALLVAGAVAAAWFYVLPRQIEWDVASDHSIRAVRWPAGRAEDWYHVGGNVEVRLRTPGGVGYRGRATNVYVDRSGEEVRRIQVAEVPVTIADAAARVVSLSREFQLDAGTLREWQERAPHDRSATLTACQRARGGEPQVCVEVRQSFNESRPFFVMFSVYWPPAPESSGLATPHNPPL